MNRILIFCLLITGLTLAQPDSLLHNGWNTKGTTGLNLSQIALSNWSQGGDNSMAFDLIGNFSFIYFSSPFRLDNNLKLSYGRTKIGGEDFRTSDNDLYLENVLSYKIDWEFKPYFSNSVRTVIANGYQYNSDTTYQISAFFDPGYVTQSLGLLYDKSKIFQTRLGLALQETFASKFTQYTDDPDTPNKIEKSKIEAGVESVSSLNYTIAKNLLIDSDLRLFTRFKHLDTWDVRWDNTLTAQVNNFVNVNLNVLVVYQKDQSPKTQLKEALQLGFTYNLF
jgi:Protein of unknown function (DUF3078)